MKTSRFLQLAVSAMLAMALTFSLVACGGDDPKELAKQSFELTKEGLGMAFKKIKPGTPEHDAMQELEKKVLELDKKVEKLSEADKKIYEDELNRLVKQ